MVRALMEPMVNVTLLAPSEHSGALISLCESLEGRQVPPPPARRFICVQSAIDLPDADFFPLSGNETIDKLQVVLATEYEVVPVRFEIEGLFQK